MRTTIRTDRWWVTSSCERNYSPSWKCDHLFDHFPCACVCVSADGGPVFPVFFMVVWLDDSMLNFSSISSWYSSETRASSSAISTGDWFVAAHSGYEADQPWGPWLPVGTKQTDVQGKKKKKCWQDLRILLSEIIAPTVRDAHHCCCTGRWVLICACGNFRENNDSPF